MTTNGTITFEITTNDRPPRNVLKTREGNNISLTASSVGWEVSFQTFVAAHANGASDSSKSLFYAAANAAWTLSGSGPLIDDSESETLFWNEAKATLFGQYINEKILGGPASLTEGGTINVVDTETANDLIKPENWYWVD